MSTSTSVQFLGNIAVICEYEFSREEKRTWLEPGSPANVSVLTVSIGGEEVDASCFSAKQLETWELAILEEITEDAESVADCAAEARHQMAMDDAMLERAA